MWCVLKCRPGKADEIMASCRRNISDEILRDVFMFTYDRMRRYEGEWHRETRSMFPNYIFLETGDPQKLSEQLEAYRRITELLEDNEQLRTVQSEEERFFRDLCGEKHHLEMSEGYILNGMTHIVHGPLVGMERRIRRIDRHKRTASLAVSDGDQARLITAGLEITSKN